MTGNPKPYDFKTLGRYYMNLLEGDDFSVENALKLLRKFEVIDENNETIYDDSEYN